MSDKSKRNDAFHDRWSLVHVVAGIILGWVMNSWLAFIVMTAWEPLEIFVISPILARLGLSFGNESWRNSLFDIFFNTIGLLIGGFALSTVVTAPFHIL